MIRLRTVLFVEKTMATSPNRVCCPELTEVQHVTLRPILNRIEQVLQTERPEKDKYFISLTPVDRSALVDDTKLFAEIWRVYVREGGWRDISLVEFGLCFFPPRTSTE